MVFHIPANMQHETNIEGEYFPAHPRSVQVTAKGMFCFFSLNNLEAAFIYLFIYFVKTASRGQKLDLSLDPDSFPFVFLKWRALAAPSLALFCHNSAVRLFTKCRETHTPPLGTSPGLHVHFLLNVFSS